MKNQIFLVLICLINITSLHAHYLWLETNDSGTIGKRHEIKVFFGEYTHGVIEKVAGENFPAVAEFDLWVIAPNGTKIPLHPIAKENFYSVKFIPTESCVHTVVLNNDNIDVIDYTKYDFCVFKTHYHSTAKIQIGDINDSTLAQNEKGLALMQLPSNRKNAKFQIWYQGKPFPQQEVKIFLADLWEKNLTTDENGIISFNLPWNTKYILETTTKEEVPGT
ncbi:MAG: DUF4198 domain-containing protein, partial [Allomuricauda sp.]